MNLKSLLNKKPPARAWISADKYHLKAYVRITSRYINKNYVPTIDIASVEVDEEHRSKGNLTAWLHKEIFSNKIVKERIIFVESVIETRLHNYFINLGFKEVFFTFPQSFYLDLTSETFQKKIIKELCTRENDSI